MSGIRAIASVMWVGAWLVASSDACGQMTAKDYVRRGATRLNERLDFDGALADVAKALELDPQHAAAISLRGEVSAVQKNDEQALKDFEQAAKLDPANYGATSNYFAVLSRVGRKRLQAGNLVEAGVLLEKAITVGQTAKAAQESIGYVTSNLASVRALQGDWEAAYSLERKAGELEAKNALAGHHLFRAHYARAVQRWDDCLADYQRTIDLANTETMLPTRNAALASRGIVYRILGRSQEAIADLSKVLETGDPAEFKYFHLQRAIAYLRAGDDSAADQDLAEYLKLVPNGQHQVEYARALGEKEPAISPSAAAEELAAAARKQLDAGDNIGAIVLTTRILHREPQFQAAFAQRGEAYFSIGYGDGALADFSQALALDDRDCFSWYFRSVVRQALFGDIPGAIEDASRGAEVQPKSLYDLCYRQRGDLYRAVGHYAESVADYSKSLEWSPNNQVAHIGRGLAYLGLQRQTEADEDFAKARELGADPDNLQQQIDNFQAIDPQPLPDQSAVTSPPAAATTGQAKKPDKPAAVKDDAPVSDNTVAANNFKSGMLLLQLGKVEMAKRIFDQAVRLDPSLKPKVDAALRENQSKR